ncbi:hypothetical protein BHE74_00015673 [Ensete ventricosum]|nr:hypothetical protein BHE74_00015673 [Ensete ventricosum]
MGERKTRERAECWEREQGEKDITGRGMPIADREEESRSSTGRRGGRRSPDAKRKVRKRNKHAEEKKKKNDETDDGEGRACIHVRARRGEATDSHSQIRKALMLSEIINYVQCLQNQVEACFPGAFMYTLYNGGFEILSRSSLWGVVWAPAGNLRLSEPPVTPRPLPTST